MSQLSSRYLIDLTQPEIAAQFKENPLVILPAGSVQIGSLDYSIYTNSQLRNIEEINLLLQFDSATMERGIKVHSSARPEVITACQSLFEKGLRIAGLTHFFDNKLGGSLHGTSSADRSSTTSPRCGAPGRTSSSRRVPPAGGAFSCGRRCPPWSAARGARPRPSSPRSPGGLPPGAGPYR